MSYDEKSQKTLAVVKAMEEALGANSNSMDKHFHKDFRWMGNQGCGTKNNLEQIPFADSSRSCMHCSVRFLCPAKDRLEEAKGEQMALMC